MTLPTERDTVPLPVKLNDVDLRYVMHCAGLVGPDGARLARAIHLFLVDVARNPLGEVAPSDGAIYAEVSRRADPAGHAAAMAEAQAVLRPPPELLVVNEDGVELGIERRADGKWQFLPTTPSGDRPRLNGGLVCCSACGAGQLYCNECGTGMALLARPKP